MGGGGRLKDLVSATAYVVSSIVIYASRYCPVLISCWANLVAGACARGVWRHHFQQVFLRILQKRKGPPSARRLGLRTTLHWVWDHSALSLGLFMRSRTFDIVDCGAVSRGLGVPLPLSRSGSARPDRHADAGPYCPRLSVTVSRVASLGAQAAK